jgi:hypothetical protein
MVSGRLTDESGWTVFTYCRLRSDASLWHHRCQSGRFEILRLDVSLLCLVQHAQNLDDVVADAIRHHVRPAWNFQFADIGPACRRSKMREGGQAVGGKLDRRRDFVRCNRIIQGDISSQAREVRNRGLVPNHDHTLLEKDIRLRRWQLVRRPPRRKPRGHRFVRNELSRFCFFEGVVDGAKVPRFAVDVFRERLSNEESV